MQKGFTKERGLSLIEILIALVVLSVGLLGIAGMQATGLRNNHAAYTKTQATALAMDMADRIRANPEGRDGYIPFDTSGAIPKDPGCIDKGCTPEEMADYDLFQWSQPLISAADPILPAGKATISRVDNLYTIKIFWREPNYKGLERTKCVDDQADDIACLQMSFTP